MGRRGTVDDLGRRAGVTEIDLAFELVRESGEPDVEGFARWMSLVERPLRASLRRFARAVDVEVVMQETFLRMWLAAQNPLREFEGDNATLRFALKVGRNVALEEIRHLRAERSVAIEDLRPDEEPSMPPSPVRDDGYLHAIRECIERLKGPPKKALLARLHGGHRYGDRYLASLTGMQPNTFLQNVARARKAVAECLHEKGL
jgi:DNA-directed RNA polymerase specialized sigma24 family protein